MDRWSSLAALYFRELSLTDPEVISHVLLKYTPAQLPDPGANCHKIRFWLCHQELVD